MAGLGPTEAHLGADGRVAGMIAAWLLQGSLWTGNLGTCGRTARVQILASLSLEDRVPGWSPEPCPRGCYTGPSLWNVPYARIT